MCHDEKVYKVPLSFNPDRYQPVSEGGNGEPLPSGQFGFGRRGECWMRFLDARLTCSYVVCVGRHLAEAVSTLGLLLTFTNSVVVCLDDDRLA